VLSFVYLLNWFGLVEFPMPDFSSVDFYHGDNQTGVSVSQYA